MHAFSLVARRDRDRCSKDFYVVLANSVVEATIATGMASWTFLIHQQQHGVTIAVKASLHQLLAMSR